MKNNTSPERKAVYIFRQVIFWFFMPFVPKHDRAKEYDGEYFCHQQVAEKPRRPLEIQEYLIDHSDVDTRIHECPVTEPINVDDDKHDGYGTHELHDLCQSSQIIFLLHIE